MLTRRSFREYMETSQPVKGQESYSLSLEQGRRGVRSPRYKHLRIFALVVCAGGVGLVWVLSRLGFLHVEDFLRYRGTHPVGCMLLFMAAYVAAVVSGLPTLPLNLAAGALWGPILGGVIAVAGMTGGAVLAFCAARFIFGQPLACRFDNKLTSWVQTEFVNKGWRFLAFVRLNPAFPAGPLNYILGLTSIDLRTYIWATFAFLLPPGILVAMAGYFVGTFLDRGGLQTGLRAALAISGALTILIAIRYAAKFLQSQQS
jgi:uncharacterized membrane protein YdjX (TVP38/TMEM64 family)